MVSSPIPACRSPTPTMNNTCQHTYVTIDFYPSTRTPKGIVFPVVVGDDTLVLGTNKEICTRCKHARLSDGAGWIRLDPVTQ